MRKWVFGVAALFAAPAMAQAPSPKPPVDRNILHAQVILEHLGFGPGILDGRAGQSLTAAVRGLQEARGLKVTGVIDPATLAVLHQYRALRPVRTLAVGATTMQGPFVDPIPKDLPEQGKLKTLGYRNPLEKLAEMFHTTPEVITALNPGVTTIQTGTMLRLPNALPGSRDYPADWKPEWRQTLNMLNVDPRQPRADHVVVDKSEGVLKIYGSGNRLVAQFSATMGSEHDPLPIGRWKINGVDTNPKFHYNPKLFWDAKKDDDPAMLPPGPNGPVGVVWIDLSKEHYGIHGTPEPQTIGRTESHGCIRLTNWDAARVALMVKPGTPALFQE
ncbi:murein L,D-transpeptidase [Sphingomonas sp. ABOLE]|uniref:L,D-transpeptidase family protein n=1 Tax=Sphingomonas sp. ABOLE TaxID=1985878 RepID=UPI000F7EE83E|nr:L,D-transpeptidase [Sphingomonas sp. ABOLE]RSV38709.1 murein L,D-transpeptidase [Sphingomonas sp. ABOLE]